MNNDVLPTLDRYYQQVSDIILARQNPITGLLPASTAITAHGDYTDAWVRDNVYSILAAWGLGLAYRKVDDTKGRAVLLEQSVVKLMRGLLIAMMKQSHKVEAFKYTQDPLDALHAKYATGSGDPVVGDDEWGHLQLDATSLYLLMLGQMTASGLRIIFSMDEVQFVQNLVHYIGRSYRTPDYGIWERGNKINHGIAEVNSSSVGMAKAALEAMDGFNCFGSEGGIDSVIHVVPDEIARARITLETALPSESLSKEVDAATLSVIGYPAFAVEDSELVDLTLNEVVTKLAGRYGCKRFLRDGHQAANEDHNRLHYEPEEMKQFEHIECEWPLFFTYLLLHYLFTDQPELAREYREKLEELLVEQNGQKLLPELYFVPLDKIEAERENPGSQEREPNENVPLVWAQSLYILGSLVQDGLLDAEDIDPLDRHTYIGRNLGKQIQFSLVAENDSVRDKLHEYGLVTQTLDQLKPIHILQASSLADAFEWLGRCERLGLSGRPHRNPRGLATSCVYEFEGNRFIFQPQFLNRHDFYLTQDNRMLVRRLKMEMGYIYRQWNLPGRPLVVMVINQGMLSKGGNQALLEFMEECRHGRCSDIPVKLGPIKNFIPTSARRSLHYLQQAPGRDEEQQMRSNPCLVLQPIGEESESTLDLAVCNEWSDEALVAQLIHVDNLQDQFSILEVLFSRHSGEFDTGLKGSGGEACQLEMLMEEVYIRASEQNTWDITRRAAAWLNKHDINLEGAVTEILVRKIALSVSRQYSKHSTFRQPAGAGEIMRIIKEFNSDDLRAQILTQELILNLGLIIKSRPKLLSNMTLIRTGQLLQLLAGHIRHTEEDFSADDALDLLMTKAPFEIAQALEYVLEHYADVQEELYQRELMKFDNSDDDLVLPQFAADMDPELGDADDWHHWRKINGSIGRYPEGFYEGVWDVVNQTAGLIIGDQWNPKRRLDHALSANMTRGEKLFQDKVDHLLNKTPVPEVRRLYYEALMVLGLIMKANPDMHTDDSMFLDVLVGHAVRLRWLSKEGNEMIAYEGMREQAWQEFYYSAPHEVANAIVEAFRFLHKEK
ncbi:glycoside hydrolase family 15 protein [Thiomicrorhabdus heinhorstiae]|uniref:Glycoside hydrolase family 15 protein n=1 Tax=Thiomicrorhabdus heinhorstiae TaxID=2748010 RepID=A0ABS0BVL7_9GAMM|nr:glycoside hydrolase family 15 protein [Thiomicrorhabdus heinhorstiae]MBF6057868.1 glycoside hydrolase family 15 protein [Thiomicrorhabdus heinhorstiae]